MKKSVKFIAVLLIVLQMFTLCSSCFADTTTNTDAGEKVEFEPVVIPLFKSTLNEWYFNNYTRALFIATLATDLDFHLLAENKGTFNTVDAVSNSAYIGKNNSNLIVYMDDNMHQVIVVYDFLTDTAAYMYADDYSEFEVRLELNNLCDSYYEIDSDDLAEAASDLFTNGSFAEITTQSDSTNGWVYFEPILLPVFDLQIGECYADSFSRARFSMLLTVELQAHLEAENKGNINLVSTVFNPSYIARKNSELAIYIDDDTHKFLIIYNFLTETVSYKYADDKANELAAIDTIMYICDSYYENDSDDLLDSLLKLIELIK